MIPYIKKLERNNFDISKMILLGFIVEVALFELFEILWILFDTRKMFML